MHLLHMATDEKIDFEPSCNGTVETAPPADTALSRGTSLRYTASNIGLAAMFFVALIPVGGRYNFGLANYIWLGGAALMGVLSLVRVPPRVTLIDVRTVLATIAMMTAPAMMRPAARSTGIIAGLAVLIELIGVTYTQMARLYMGRRFGLFPANRGIVANGPFRLVRHPVYAGWFVLTVGFIMAYPSGFNVFMLLVTIPFMIWRISLEEELLLRDPEYQAYAERTRYRLIPGVY